MSRPRRRLASDLAEFCREVGRAPELGDEARRRLISRVDSLIAACHDGRRRDPRGLLEALCLLEVDLYPSSESLRQWLPLRDRLLKLL